MRAVSAAQLAEWDRAERSRPKPDERLLVLLAEVQRLHALLDNAGPAVRDLTERYVSAIRSWGETEMEACGLCRGLRGALTANPN